MAQRKEINEVFTPRNPTVNIGMYIERPDMEKMLYRSVMGSMHSFLFGESGNGKSWMYKNVFTKKSVHHVVANCANASRKKSLTDEIYSVCVEHCPVKTGFTETKTAGISYVGKAELSHKGEYVIQPQDKLLTAFESLYENSSEGKSVIVLDNVETIFSDEKLMGELSDIIILLDDARYAAFNVKFLIVGIQSEVIQYFSSSKNPSSVGNRIDEIQRITGLNYQQVQELIERGFKKYLLVELTEAQLKRLSLHIFNITLGVPQRIHEYCECLAYAIEDNDWVYSPSLLDNADHSWLLKGLRESYTIIEKHLNSEETTDGRRNQVIYALGKLAVHQIETNKVGDIVVSEFSKNFLESYSGIGIVLANLSKGENPILKKITNSNSYVMTDPRHLMCIRVMLYKDPETEKISKKVFSMN